MKIVINPDFEVANELFDALAAARVPEGAQLIYGKRNRLYTYDCAGNVLNIKAFKIPAFVNSLVYTHLRRSKARRSYEHSLQLTKLGIGTADPAGYVEIKHRGRLSQSYYVCRQLEGYDTMRRWERKPDAEPLLRALAAFMVRMHAARVMHGDFTPGNVLYKRLDDGTYDFRLIDVNRMKIGTKIGRRQIVRNLRAMNPDSVVETRRLARYYAEAAGIADEDRLADQAEAALHAYRRRKQRLKRLKQLFKTQKTEQNKP